MAWCKKRVIALTALLIADTALCGWVYFANFPVAEVDPNLMRAQCPGGKDWDLPGSSCHNGLIADKPIPLKPATVDAKQQPVVEKKKRGR